MFAPESPSECSFSLLLQLDDIKDPGVSEDIFQDLFLKCRKCRRHMTRRATIFHTCPAAETEGNIVEVIDLTNQA